LTRSLLSLLHHQGAHAEVVSGIEYALLTEGTQELKSESDEPYEQAGITL